MDRKQREDAINEVSQSLALVSNSPHIGSRAQSHASSIHHYLQGIIHGQAMSLHRDGLRGWWGSVHKDCKPEENRKG